MYPDIFKEVEEAGASLEFKVQDPPPKKMKQRRYISSLVEDPAG